MKMKTHHTTQKNKSVLIVQPARQFAVTRRAPAFPDEPEWVVYSLPGASANVVAAFYSQSDAQEYACWRSEQPVIKRAR
jgi:hypothetical protein